MANETEAAKTITDWLAVDPYSHQLPFGRTATLFLDYGQFCLRLVGINANNNRETKFFRLDSAKPIDAQIAAACDSWGKRGKKA